MKALPLSIEKSTSLKSKPDLSSNALGFGKYFTDHMLSVKYTEEAGWGPAAITAHKALELAPGASVLHYGQALFEGMKAFKHNDGKIVLFKPEYNWARMKSGAERLCIPMVDKETFIQGISELVKIDEGWIPSEPGSLYIRPTLIGTEEFLGVRPSREALFFTILSPVSSYYSEGAAAPVKIWVETKYLRAAEGGLGATKAAANYATSLKAALEARQKGYSQVLWLDATRNYIEEVGTMNVFFVFENEIVTPSLDGTILAGGVRDSIIQLLKHWNLPITERKLSLEEALKAHEKGQLIEAFGTGTAAVITPIGQLGSENWSLDLRAHTKSGELSKKIYNYLTGVQFGHQKDELNWLVEI